MDSANTDFRNTLKLTWLADVPQAVLTPAVCVHFDHIISKGVLKPDEDFKNFVNYDSMVTKAGIQHTLPLQCILTSGM